MKILRQDKVLRVRSGVKKEYPLPSITVALILLYLSPFVSDALAILSFLIYLYRIVRYDARVFATDFCLLMPITSMMKIGGGVPLAIYLSLLAGIWYLIRGGIRGDASFVLLIALLNYLITRMQMNINDFVLCFGQMFVLCILLPKQNEASAARAIKAFCVNLVVSSLFVFLLRNTYQIRALTGPETPVIRGTSVRRFSCLFGDPNYYMTFLTVGIALLLKLKHSRMIHNLLFWCLAVGMAFFGVLTYSKTFFLMFVLLVGVFVMWQFWERKYIKGVVFTVVGVVALILIMTLEESPFAVVLNRFTSARNLNELTTSRAKVYLLYIMEIFSDVPTFLFGKGLAADGLYRAPHNLYLEITYHIGVVGLALIVGFYAAMVRIMVKRSAVGLKQNLIEKYMVLLVVVMLFLTLHGMFMQFLYAELFLAFLSFQLTSKPGKEAL